MKSFTTEELTQRFLQITNKMQIVVEEKNWPMFNHFLIERNDVIEFLDPKKNELTEQDLEVMREAWEIQLSITKRMEEYRAEIQALQLQSQKVHQVGLRYLEQSTAVNITYKQK
jgi:hypothetical protein